MIILWKMSIKANFGGFFFVMKFNHIDFWKELSANTRKVLGSRRTYWQLDLCHFKCQYQLWPKQAVILLQYLPS